MTKEEKNSNRSPPKAANLSQTTPKKKLKTDTEKAKEKSAQLRFGKAEITPEEASRMSKAQKRELYASAAARSAVHRPVEQYEEDNVGTQALNEGSEAAENLHTAAKHRYTQKLKKAGSGPGKQSNKRTIPTKKSSRSKPPATKSELPTTHWFSRWKQKQDIKQSYYAARAGKSSAAGTARTAASPVPQNVVENFLEKGKSIFTTATDSIAHFAQDNAHLLVIVGAFLLLLLLVMSAFSSCGVLFVGTTQVSGQTFYTAKDKDIKGAETDYKKLEQALQKKIDQTPTTYPGYDEYRYHLDEIEHDPWQLTSYLTVRYDDYTRSEVQAELRSLFQKQYKLTTWVEIQIRSRLVPYFDIFTMTIQFRVEYYEYRIFHTKLVNKGLETVIQETLTEDEWSRYEVLQETQGGRSYLFKNGQTSLFSARSGEDSVLYRVSAEALTDNNFASLYREAEKHLGTPYVWGGSDPETGFDCSGYVCWVYNQNGYDLGRLTAEELWQISQHISEQEARPGDLVFFEGTYDTDEKSHVGLYLGSGVMISAGDPIKYSNIHSDYWEPHLSGFGRIEK